jgi:hypothetical protein
MRASALGAAALTATAILACSQSPQRAETDDVADRKEWKELETRLPPYPKSENLVRFDAGSASSHGYYIDAPSLAIGADGVVRYALVVRTAAGATNVTFEGIRCDGRQQKYYAVGNANGTWSPVRNPLWRRIQLRDPDRLHRALVDGYLCPGGVPVSSEKDALERLRQGTAGEAL